MPVLDALTTLLSTVLHPLQWLVAWVLVRFHDLWTAAGLDPAGGPAWAASIVGLVVVVRVVLLPLFVAQVRGSRRLQALQPEIRRLRARYAGRTDAAGRQALQQEQVALVRARAAGAMAGCWPLLLQAPVLIALFATLDGVREQEAVGPLSDTLVRQADAATLLGAPLSGSLWGSGDVPTVVLAAVLVALMAATQLVTQWVVGVRSAAGAPVGEQPLAQQQQKVLTRVLPLLVVVPGLHLPIGVLLYWLTSAVWSAGQQLVLARWTPDPGTTAHQWLARRRTRRAARRGTPVATEDPVDDDAVRPDHRRRQRRQPRSAGSRSARRRPAGGPT